MASIVGTPFSSHIISLPDNTRGNNYGNNPLIISCKIIYRRQIANSENSAVWVFSFEVEIITHNGAILFIYIYFYLSW